MTTFITRRLLLLSIGLICCHEPASWAQLPSPAAPSPFNRGLNSPAQKGTGINPVYANRLTAQTRAAAIAQYGGNAVQVEQSVLKSLNWLKSQQNDDGSWGSSDKITATGFALLAFLGHGESQASQEFGSIVHQGIQFLLKSAKANGGKLSEANLAYPHSIGTYALAEDFALTANQDVLAVLESELKLIFRSQTAAGSWNQRYDPSRENDLCVTGWNVQALKAAKNAGVSTDGLDACLQRVSKFVLEDYDPKTDRFAYSRRGDNENDGLLGTGIFCLQQLGGGNSKEARGAIHTARTCKCSWDCTDSYTWYYMTLAMFHCGGTDWGLWRNQLNQTLASHSSDGRWSIPGRNSPSIIPFPKESADIPLYHTTLLCMTQEIYYRFVPSSK